ncbi:MAG: FtsH protease activity modulator HflK [Alphaproteobacteria bacterium]
MPDNDNSGNKRKNPWARPGGGNDGPPRSGGDGWKPGGGGRGPQEPPDIDEMLRRAQANFRSIMPGNFHNGRMAGLIALAIVALWFASGIFIVQPGEHAVVQRFGEWVRTQDQPGVGYHWPVPIETRTKVNVSEIRLMNIGFIEAGYNGATRRDIPEESLMLTADRNIVDLNIVIQWNVKSAEEFLFNVDDQENTIKKLAESAIREVAGQTAMFPIITNQRKQVADRTKDIVQTNLDAYKSGVNITQVLIEKAEVHPDVQAAFQDVQSAKQDAEDVQNRAEAYREDILPRARGTAIQMQQEAEGYRQTTVAQAKGDADRFNAVYEAYLSGEDVTRERIYIETMEDVLRSTQKTILGLQPGSGVVPYLPLGELNRTKSVVMQKQDAPVDPMAEGQ